MKCVFCGGALEDKKVTFCYAESNKYLFVEDVPAEVCKLCGEKTYSPDVTDKLLKFAKERNKPEKTIEVPVYEFS